MGIKNPESGIHHSRFPLPFEHVRWRTRRYAVSDFRLVTLRRGRVTAEIALHDIQLIAVTPSLAGRLTGLGTIVVSSARPRDPGLRIAGVVGARHRALRLNLLVADIRGVPPDDSLLALPMPSLWRVAPAVELRMVLWGPTLVLLTVAAVVIGLHGHEVRVAFGPDDPVRPNGIKRSHEEILAFMEREVLPWARVALEPVVGRGQVACETCHGKNAEARRWAMPAVSALPEPAVRQMATAAGSDSQVRNALHGYLAEEDNAAVAAHMRGVVVPGMAALLRRPAYDFAKTYEFNRSRDAFGCYHCHKVGPT